MSDTYQKALEEALKACIALMQNEMGWEYFRAEMLYFDKPENKRCSLQNAKKLREFIDELRAESPELDALISIAVKQS